MGNDQQNLRFNVVCEKIKNSVNIIVSSERRNDFISGFPSTTKIYKVQNEYIDIDTCRSSIKKSTLLNFKNTLIYANLYEKRVLRDNKKMYLDFITHKNKDIKRIINTRDLALSEKQEKLLSESGIYKKNSKIDRYL